MSAAGAAYSSPMMPNLPGNSSMSGNWNTRSLVMDTMTDCIGFPRACRNTPEIIEQYEERKPSSFLYSLVMGSSAVSYNQSLHQQLFMAQADVIKELARKESCVFVGRCADYVLRDVPDLFSVFVHASLPDCVRRVKKASNMTDQEAEMLIMRTNKARSEYYRHFTDKKWGASGNYHLTIDSSDLTADGAAELILEYLKLREKYRSK